MNLTPNPFILGLQVLPFVVTLLALKWIIVDPMVAYLRAREGASEGGPGHASDALNLAEKNKQAQEQKMLQLRAAMAASRAEIVQGALKREQEVLQEARLKIEQEMKTFRGKLEEELVGARATVRNDADRFAAEICSRLVGRPLN